MCTCRSPALGRGLLVGDKQIRAARRIRVVDLSGVRGLGVFEFRLGMSSQCLGLVRRFEQGPGSVVALAGKMPTWRFMGSYKWGYYK